MGRQLLSQAGEPLWAADERLRRLEERFGRLSAAVDAQGFLSRHRLTPDAHVVEVGCGTGEFTARLADLVPQGQVVGVEPDLAKLSVAQARRRPGLSFVAGRMQELYLAVPPNSADLVVAREALQWAPLSEYPLCFTAANTVLRPGGWLHTESGGAGNLRRLAEVLDAVAADWDLPPARVTLPDPGVAYDLVVAAGFAVPAGGVQTVAGRRAFDRRQLLQFVRTHAIRSHLAGADAATVHGFLQAVANQIDKLANRDGSYDQTVVRLDILAQRPAA